MENKISNIIYYIVKNYPYLNDLSLIRLTKLFYLCDIEYQKENSKTLSGLKWNCGWMGPDGYNLRKNIEKNNNLSIDVVVSKFGVKKTFRNVVVYIK